MLPRYPVASGAEGACRVGAGRVTGTWGLGVQTEVYIKPGNGKNGKEHADGQGKKETKSAPLRNRDSKPSGVQTWTCPYSK